ncbi:glycosyl hydrolase-related protein [Irregularibacter muris]|uniref:Glycosyl hydrolase-related protein n=1 Tax=Irregularibacter muris TaxID=1796619 RepID=A0AAE3HG71_9FIRM|nr:glycoside hydrolase family 38 C-terminal domain-containing protein [Irregularibacter muris]MCR1898444.1 glycosyl hydrolase-related protein [Irregularibacter muris]
MPYFISSYKKSIDVFKAKVEESIYHKIAPLNIHAWVTEEPVDFKEKTMGKYISLNVGESWGKLWDCAWFNFTGTVPKAAAHKKVVLLIDISGEICIFDEDGCPNQGLTNVSSEFDLTLGKPGKRVVNFLEKACGGENIDLWADGGCNDLFGNYKDSGKIKEAHIALLKDEMRKLYYDIEVLQELMEQLPEDSSRHQSILFTLFHAFKVMKNYDKEEAKKAREILSAELNKNCGDESLSISAIGHAHIDLAWLWPIRETIRKGARTFSTVLSNMDRYPEYIFGASQPQLYAWIKERYPKLYRKIKVRIAEGRWEAQGGMWVEPDTNISGGEALIRQVLYGKMFFKKEFDKEMKTLWLPDVFGYTASLPQILKKSGLDYFMTIKLSWNEYNQFPHHTFMWEGIDGSKVLVHMPPEGTYNSSASPKAIKEAERNFKDKGVSQECLMLFGIGDGGGGPGEEHLERLEREKHLNGLVPVKQEPSLEFFKRIEKNMANYKTWSGELYLEKHQGTYTTQAKNKCFNRKMEFALRELEYVSVLAQIEGLRSYPQAEIETIWKEVLLYQFHDILPGSSIKRVYDESLERYEYLLKHTEKLIEDTYRALLEDCYCTNQVTPDFLLASKITPKTKAAGIINSLSWDREEWLMINGEWAKVKVPAMNHRVIQSSTLESTSFGVTAEDHCIENNLLKVSFNEDGSLKSVFDKEFQREALDTNFKANVLTPYEETYGNAWDFSPTCHDIPQDKFKLEYSESMVRGPKAIVKQIYTYHLSTIEQEIILTEGSRRIDFKTKVDWKESNRMLRTSFPVNVFTHEVSCDIQFGSIKRPTHDNTSWDMAKYEICAHKYVDLSQADYGVALLNDCKYGHRVKGNTINLNLLRSTDTPGAEADKGTHEFIYSLYPHGGDCIEGQVIQASYELNLPLRVVEFTGEFYFDRKKEALVRVDNESIMIETIKKAEHSDDIIIRLYECNGGTERVKLNFDHRVKDVQLVNLMEEPTDRSLFSRGNNELEFKPFEIITLKINCS